MFSNADFPKYISERKKFYNELENFIIQPEHISNPIKIDKVFFENLNQNFEKFLRRRLEPEKFSKAENKEYKTLMKEIFPETSVIFDHPDPTIYWFKIDYFNDLTNADIINHFSRKRKAGSGWWTKVNMANASSKTDILYLGKIETAFQNRFISHIGLGNDFTSSLKLQRWMPDLDISLTFNFLKLDKKWKIYTEDIEKVLWDATQPLLGASPRIKSSKI